MENQKKKVKCLIVDTTAFIQNVPLQDIAETIVTCQEVIDEIKNKSQLKRLVVLPYDLIVKEPFPENIKHVTAFAIKTGDYRSLSATDIKIIALTYQLEKENMGVEHLNSEPTIQKTVKIDNGKVKMDADVTGFFNGVENNENEDLDEGIVEKLENLQCNQEQDVLVPVENEQNSEDEAEQNSEDEAELNSGDEAEQNSEDENEDNDDDSGWITPSNIQLAKKQLNSKLMEEKDVMVACITTDFAMQNVLRQMNLNVSALDGRIIKQLRTFIFRCYACFKTTSVMTHRFCPKCGNDTLKKVAVSLDENGQMQIHINGRRPLTGRGKKYSIPRIKGGKHPNNPILVADQPMPDNRPTRLARTKTNPLNDDYIAGFSPFVMRDVTSKSAQLHIRPQGEFKHWMRKNPNEACRRRK